MSEYPQPKKPSEFVFQCMENICTLQRDMLDLDRILRNANTWRIHQQRYVQANELRDELQRLELDEWRRLLMFGICVDQKMMDRIKVAVYDRFLSEDTQVSDWTNGGVFPISYLTADVDEFRDMARKAFSPKDC